jgi:hypothetical protein
MGSRQRGRYDRAKDFVVPSNTWTSGRLMDSYSSKPMATMPRLPLVCLCCGDMGYDEPSGRCLDPPSFNGCEPLPTRIASTKPGDASVSPDYQSISPAQTVMAVRPPI